MTIKQWVKKSQNKKGFTLIELIMVIMIVAIMAAVGIPQFINYKREAKNAATKHLLGLVRSGIQNQYAQMQLRCGGTAGVWPSLAAIQANSVSGAGCTTGPGNQVITAAEAQIVAGKEWPVVNPWGGSSAITLATGTSVGTKAATRCAQLACDQAAGSPAFSGGWCYDVTTGEFWADSDQATLDHECSF